MVVHIPIYPNPNVLIQFSKKNWAVGSGTGQPVPEPGSKTARSRNWKKFLMGTEFTVAHGQLMQANIEKYVSGKRNDMCI